MSHTAVIRAGMNISLLKADSKSERSLKKKKKPTNCCKSQKSVCFCVIAIKSLTAFYLVYLLPECFRALAGLSMSLYYNFPDV